MKEITVIQKPDYITYEEIQNLLSRAHTSNIKSGLIYRTAIQSSDELRNKIGSNGRCFIAVMKDENDEYILCGTITVCFIKINYWYYSGDVALIKLFGVDPSYKGKDVGKHLLDRAIKCAKQNNMDVVLLDSAEQNEIVYYMCIKKGFQLVDYCRYDSNNFITAVYAKFLNGSEVDDGLRKIKLIEKHYFLENSL